MAEGGLRNSTVAEGGMLVYMVSAVAEGRDRFESSLCMSCDVKSLKDTWFVKIYVALECLDFVS